MTYQFDFPCAYQFERPQAVFRQLSEDFLVEEELGFELTGSGEHLWLWVEKKGMNTIDAARKLAQLTGTHIKDVGFAGLKDKQAVTRQWFSIKSSAELPGGEVDRGGMKILSQTHNSRKLRKGSHRGNRFVITLKQVSMGHELMQSIAETLSLKGVPNYFGPQRFGNSGNNVYKAQSLFDGKIGKVPRFQRGLYLSAARSYLFNTLLAVRVRENSWDQFLPGDVMALAGSSSVFKAQEGDEAIPERLSSLDIHPTGPLWGLGELSTSGQVKIIEAETAVKFPVLAKGLESTGMKQERRALRVVPENLKIGSAGEDQLVVEFSLPTGAYATSVLREIVEASGL